MLNDSEQSELEKADSLRDNMSSLTLPNGRPKCPYRAISGRPYLHFARKMADGRWPTVIIIELLDIECALCHVTGVQFDKNICPYKSAILDFLQKLPFAFAQNVLGRANFALINPPFCGENFLTDTR